MDRLADVWGGGSSVVPSFGNITNGGSSTLSFYTGAAPASADLPATGTLVATYNMTGHEPVGGGCGRRAALNGAGPTVLANGTRHGGRTSAS
jgi:hypothetical protein